MKQVKTLRPQSDKTRRKSSEPSWNKNFIDAAYKAILGRKPDPVGLENYLHLVSKDSDYAAVLSAILESQEFVDKQLIRHNAKLLVKLTYSGLMNRLPDAEEFLYWVNFLKQNGDFPGLVSTLAKSVEVAQHLGTVSPQLPPDHCSYERPALVFLHIAKTAGTTFRNLLIRSYGETVVCQFNHEPNILYHKSPFQLADYAVFAVGHANHDVIRYIPRRQKLLLTCVREPKSRLVSHFNFAHAHNLTFSNNKDPMLELANQLNILEFLEHPETHDSTMWWNHMTWVVMGDQIWTEWKKILTALSARPDLNARVAFLKKVNMAIRNRLSEFFWVGIQEDFDASVHFFFDKIKRPPPEEIPAENVLNNRIGKDFGFKSTMPLQHIYEITPRVFELMELDLILYKKAKAMFAKRVKAITI